MNGPCLCGDPYCHSCFPGNDGGELEAAEEGLMKILSEANLHPTEYQLLGNIALPIITASRKLAEEYRQVLLQDQAEAKLEEDLEKYNLEQYRLEENQ